MTPGQFAAIAFLLLLAALVLRGIKGNKGPIDRAPEDAPSESGESGGGGD